MLALLPIFDVPGVLVRNLDHNSIFLQPAAVSLWQRLVVQIEVVRAQDHCDVVDPDAVRIRVGR